MFWAGSLILRFIVALILHTFIMVGLKFCFDRCTPNNGYHIYTMNIQLPEAVCEPFAHWATSARMAENSKKNSQGAFAPKEDWVAEMLSSSPSPIRAFGLDSLPLVFIDERTTPRVVKLVLYWLLPPLFLALIAEAIASLRSGKLPA